MKLKTFRDNLFAMNTRRFGAVAEIAVSRLISGKHASNIHHDLRDYENLRIEVKFSRVERKHNQTIDESNVLEVIENEGLSVRMFPFLEWRRYDFDCNIQQIKPGEFDVLFYGLLFADRILVFVMTPEQLNIPDVHYSNKQHKGNVGEGQFHITPKTLQYHLDNHLLLTLSYDDLFMLLNSKVAA